MTDYLVEIGNAEVSYPSGEKAGGRRIVLNDVNLHLRKGDFLTVVGPSGCGKSTLLRLILGSQRPNQGRVLVDGQEVSHVTRDCGIVFQAYSLFPNRTVLDNVMAGPILEQTGLIERLVGQPFLSAAKLLDRSVLNDATAQAAAQAAVANETLLKRILGHVRYWRVLKEAGATARELLTQCGLDPVRDADKYPYELSGGMRQRVAIAQAVMMKPKILLMDEPFGALDIKTREDMQDFIHEQWQRHGITVFFVTHDLEEACKLGTRLICLSQYWRGGDGQPGKGAKILIDKKVVGGDQRPSEFVDTPEFEELVQEINSTALDKNNMQPIGARHLSHEDAVRPAEVQGGANGD